MNRKFSNGAMLLNLHSTACDFTDIVYSYIAQKTGWRTQKHPKKLS